MRRTIYLLAVLVVWSVCASHGQGAPVKMALRPLIAARDVSTREQVEEVLPFISRAKPDDVVDVYYMEGIMSEFWQWKILFNRMHIWHGALGFFNRNSGKNCTFEYYPPAFIGAVFPKIHNPGPHCTLEWDNKAIVEASPDITWEKWTGGYHKISTITGKQFNEYVEWSPSYNQTDGMYYVWNVENKRDGTTFLPSQQCFDFVWDSFEYLYEHGARYDKHFTAQRINVNMYTDKPTGPVDPSNPKVQKQLCEFYDLFQFKNESMLKEIEEIWKFFPEPKYVYAFGQYYELHPNFPYMAWHLDKTKLPGQK